MTVTATGSWSRALFESARTLLDLGNRLAAKNRDVETLLLQQARANTEPQEGPDAHAQWCRSDRLRRVCAARPPGGRRKARRSSSTSATLMARWTVPLYWSASSRALEHMLRQRRCRPRYRGG